MFNSLSWQSTILPLGSQFLSLWTCQRVHNTTCKSCVCLLFTLTLNPQPPCPNLPALTLLPYTCTHTYLSLSLLPSPLLLLPSSFFLLPSSTSFHPILVSSHVTLCPMYLQDIDTLDQPSLTFLSTMTLISSCHVSYISHDLCLSSLL